MTSGGAAASCPDTGNCIARATPTTTPSTPSHVTMRRLMTSPLPTTNHQLPTSGQRSALLIALSRRAFASTCWSAAAAATGPGPAPTAAALRLLHRTPFALDPLGEVFGERAVLGTLSGKRVADRLIAFMTLVGKQHAAVERRQRDRDRERRRIRDGIVDGQLVLDDIVGDPPDPLGHLHLVAVAQTVAVEADARLVRQVDRFDDERVAFPAAARRAEVLTDVARMRPAVGVDDPGVVNHLVADGDGARALDDAIAVPVDDARHRAVDAARDAAVVQGEVLDGLEGAIAERPAVARRRALARLGQRLRHDAGRRIDHVRGLAEGAACEVVAERARRVVLTPDDPILDLFLPRRPLLVVEVKALRRRTGGTAAAAATRHTERRIVAAPGALEVGLTPRRFRRRPVRRLRTTVECRDDQRWGDRAAALTLEGECRDDRDHCRHCHRCEHSPDHACLLLENPKSQIPNPKPQIPRPNPKFGFGIWDLGFGISTGSHPPGRRRGPELVLPPQDPRHGHARPAVPVPGAARA